MAVFHVDLTITNPDGQKATLTHAFEFAVAAPAPTIAAVSPRTGPAGGGTSVTITGSGFQPGAQVMFGTVSAANVVVSADGTTLTVTTPKMV
jgi:broad specificity polyphosphatase/5'/3'-nucleotidase SurE